MANIFEQFKLYKQHNELLKKAEDIFPSSVLYNNFKDQLSIALKEGDLSQAEFALDTFELMQQNETSPLFYDTLNQRLSDPLFCEFSDLIMNITPQYAEAEFVATREMNLQFEDDFKGEQTIVSSTIQTFNGDKVIPTNNQKILNIVKDIMLNNSQSLQENNVAGSTTATNEKEDLENKLESANTDVDVEQIIKEVQLKPVEQAKQQTIPAVVETIDATLE